MAYLALYRLYRPGNFSEVVGQEHITRTLKNQVETGRIGHAYLFSGARGTGKTSTAKVLARAVNCLEPQHGEPCGQCEVCKTSNDDLSVDILEIDAASNNGVDEIRDLREKISFAPTLCRYKVYIIDEVHMLSTGAFNALLKTLEEPPAHAVFILATTEMHKLPATILSRCQRFDFKRIPEAIILQQLKDVAEKQGALCEEEALQAVAHAAAGGMRDALSILDQCLGFVSDKLAQGGMLDYADVVKILGGAGADTASSLADAVMASDVVSCMDIVQGVYDGGADMAVFTRELIEFFRQLMIKSANSGKAGLPLQAVQELSHAESAMRYSPQPRVTLEAALVRLCVANEGEDVSALLQRIERLEATVDSLRQNPPVVYAQPEQSAQHGQANAKPLNGRQGDDAEPKQAVQESGGSDNATSAQSVDNKQPLPEQNYSDVFQAKQEYTDDQNTLATPPGDLDEINADATDQSREKHADQADTTKPDATADEEPSPMGNTVTTTAGDDAAATEQLSAQQLFDDMLVIVRKSNPGVRPMLKLAAAETYQDGKLTLRLSQDDAVIARALNQPNILKSLSEAATKAAGRQVEVLCAVGKEAPKPAAANASQQMLEQVKQVFGMDVEIID